jgi:hypothetical protein
VRYWRKQKELLENVKSDSRECRGPKYWKSHPEFSAKKLEKNVRKLRE